MPTYRFEMLMRMAMEHAFLHESTLYAIEFNYSFDECVWHISNQGKIRVVNITDNASKRCFALGDFSFEQQMVIHKACVHFIKKHALNPYSNIIPLYQYPAHIRIHQESKRINKGLVIPLKIRKAKST